MTSNDPNVLISYTHDSDEHKERVLGLSQRLRGDGIDCHIDRYETSPPEGWPRWMINQVENSDFVLVACTETYNRRFRGNEAVGKGLGAQWEGLVITQELFDSAAKNAKFIPIIFSPEDEIHIPAPLRGATFYRLYLEEGYDDLYRRLTAQPKIPKPPLGPRRVFDSFDSHTTVPSASPSQTINAPVEQKSAPSGRDLSNLVLLFLSDHKYIFTHSQMIERGDELAMDLLPDDARKTAFLADIKNQQFRPELAAAFGITSVQGQVVQASTLHQGGQEIWQLRLKPSKDDGRYSPLADFTFNNYTPEDIAELKARRILLNEQPQVSRGRDRLTDGLLESMISGEGGLIREVKSPLPELFQLYKDDVPYFLEASRLMSVLYLRLTGVIEHIFRLELTMSVGDRVSVYFEGQRAPRYSNQPAHVIKFLGECSLN